MAMKWPEANADQVEDALNYLKERVAEHLEYRGLPSEAEAAGRRFGAYNVLLKLGYGDAAQQAIREVYEEKGLRY